MLRKKMSFIQTLLSLPTPTSPRISPDGQKIVYSTSLPYDHKTGENFRSTLWLAETGNRDSARPLTSGKYHDREPRWCADGTGIVFLSDLGKVGEGCAVYVLVLEEGRWERRGEVRPVTAEGNLRGIDRFEVLPGKGSGGGGGGRGETVVYLSADEKNEEARAKERQKDDARVWGEDWAYNRLRMVDLDSKKSTTLMSGDVHLIDFACSEDGSKVAVGYVRNPDLEARYLYGTSVAVYDRGTKDLTEICHFATYITDLTWVGGSVYFIGPADETTAASSQMVFRIDLSAGIERQGYTRQAYGEVNCAMKLKRLGTALAVGVQDGMADEIHILEGRESRTLFTQNQTLEAWDAIFYPNGDNEIILVLTTSSPSHPAEIYTTTVSSSIVGGEGGGASLTSLSAHGKDLTTTYPNQTTSMQCKFLTCASADGSVQLDAALFLPTHQSTRPNHLHHHHHHRRSPFPTLVTLHGGPYYRFTSLFPPLLPHSIFTSLLLSAGYAVLLPNYRGSSGRGRAFAEFGKLGGSGREGYEDVITLTSHAIREGYVDPARVGVGGWSQGGFLSYLCGVRNWAHGYGVSSSTEDEDEGRGSVDGGGNGGGGGGSGSGRGRKEGGDGDRRWRFRVAIPGAGVSDCDTLCLTSDIGCVQGQLAGSGEPPWRLGRGDVRNRATSAIWEVKEGVEKGVTIPPMLILHGEKDERVPLEQGRGMRRALEGIGVPCEFVVYPREGHFIRERNHLVDIAERSLRFVEKYIGGAHEKEVSI
ncbi:hypothetical protein D0862_05182 [Hortaea werneckii]|uniref:Dipeptidyl-peptidase V n=1 Tax=Hortaea werneckii TaxID=91943 RepID=A0A3M7GW31_HORWE|nr:hypothetical protein D0862_05182 [Hortaea werneckii]